MKLAVRLAAVAPWLQGRLDAGRARGRDRGDISITTIIIWVAAVAGALLIAGTIAVVMSKYNGKLSGL
ncbi:hypothetical protein SAMN05216223_116151 [Actinacidiphila yanglinensis]|uniref:Uncharacterized protein n=1 Tax=Actinacidiphila yanglinensis TaxID=310779 RepID=A0A1H6DLX1_9ACTN|nr:hypothetical protein [Actinacidiphila yanglinensis]SEG85853.1 hypothetical protein SAMN05216223_116151 [Actinacidiphila yanglinensis]